VELCAELRARKAVQSKGKQSKKADDTCGDFLVKENNESQRRKQFYE
jgi:hypothetical protein